MKELLSVILAAILAVILIAIAVVLTVAFGYVIGMFIVVLPFVGGWLTNGIPVDADQIPAITAWLAVAGTFIGGGSIAGRSKNNK